MSATHRHEATPRSLHPVFRSRVQKTALPALLVLLSMLAGCTQQAPKTTPSAAVPSAPSQAPQPAEGEQRPTAPRSSSSGAESMSPQNLEGFVDEPALKDVFFQLDRADIVGEQAVIMRANARWLLARWLIQNLHDQVLIEGHADDTGKREDQLAVAELRAQAIASFLRAMNVPATNLLTVSYGSDRPLCKGKSDACAAKNRRVHFRVKRQ